MRSIVVLLLLGIALPATVAWSTTRDDPRKPRFADRGVTGELERYDAVEHTLMLSVDGRTERFQISSGTVVQEGANIISADRLNEFRGHLTKVTLAGASPSVARLMISPEQVVSGEIAAYDPAKHDLQVNTVMGSKVFPIGVDAWCHLGPKTVDSASLAHYVGHDVKVTVSQRTGAVLSVFVSKKSE